MWRKPLAVVLSGAWLFASTVANAQQTAAAPGLPQLATSSAQPSKNTPPLAPGGAVGIREAQGYSDLGFGVILLSWLAAAGLLVWIFTSTDEDEDNAPTGTF